MTTTIDRFSDEYRRTHLGASQIPAAIGVSPWMRPIELWEQFVGLAPPTESNEAIELGHALEEGIAKVAARRLGLDLVKGQTIEHPRMPWLVATPDYVTADGTRGVEVKSSGLTSYQNADARERWGDDGDPNGAPVHVTAQAIDQMFIMRSRGSSISVMDVAALVPPFGVRIYPVAYDEDVARAIVSQAAEFWRRVQENDPPPPDASDAFAEHLKRRYPQHRPDKWAEGPVIDEMVAVFREAEARFDEAEAAYKLAKNQIQQAIGDAEGVRGPWGKIPWRGVQGRETLKQERVIDELRALAGSKADEILARCKERGAGYRRFGPATWTKK